MNAPAVILIAFATSLATATGTVYAIERLQLFREQTTRQTIPNLVGLAESDAKTNLESLGLKMMVQGRKPSVGADPGTVVEQVPPPGQLLEVGNAVGVTFALEPPKVPDVLGKRVEDATRLLEKAGYLVKVGEPVADDEAEEGRVVSQSPEAASALAQKETVTLRVSSGAAAIEVPKLVGMGMAAAKAEAEKANLKLTVQWVDIAETASHVVLRQIPAPGETLEPESEVKVVINR